MKPATTATVEFAIDLLLQSIHDENKNDLEAIRYTFDKSSHAGGARPDTDMLSQVDNYASAMQSTLHAVQRRLLDKISVLHTEHNKLIPLHKLPIEVFVLIITRALAPFQTRQWSDQTHLRRLVTLCTICKQWNDVISRTASLWATIDIRDPTAITSSALSRSANHPLNIIGAPSSSPVRFWPNATDGWERFVNTAIAVSTRWHSVQLAVASREAALAVVSVHAPRLVMLEVGSTTEYRLDIQNGGSTFPAIGSQLRGLALDRLAIPWDSWALCNLQYLSISGLKEFVPSYEELLGILGGCPELVELELSLDRPVEAGILRRRSSFTLARLGSMKFWHFSPSLTLALLETIDTPSVRSVHLDIDFSGSGHLFPSIVKRVSALFSSVVGTEYHLDIDIYSHHLEWAYFPTDEQSNWRYFIMDGRNFPAPDKLEVLWAEVGTNRFAPEFVRIDLDMLADLETTLLLPKLDSINTIRSLSVYNGNANPLFTYMSNPTTNSEWGLPTLENLTLYDCDYDPEQLLDMVLARYEDESSEGGDISGSGRNRPPPFKALNIHHAPGEADEDTLNVVEDTVGHDCFTLYEDVDR